MDEMMTKSGPATTVLLQRDEIIIYVIPIIGEKEPN